MIDSAMADICQVHSLDMSPQVLNQACTTFIGSWCITSNPDEHASPSQSYMMIWA